jgi:two-component system sensor histidine kinase KdpD
LRQVQSIGRALGAASAAWTVARGRTGEEDERLRWESYGLALLLVAGAAVVSQLLSGFLNGHDLALPFIGALLLSGGLFGLRPALVAAVAASLTHNFFFTPPLFTFAVTPADLLALATFLTTAVLVGGMAGRLRDRALSATRRLHRLAALLEASRDLSAAGTPAEVAQVLVERLQAEIGVEAAIWSAGGRCALLAASGGAGAAAAAVPVPLGPARSPEAGCRWAQLATARGTVGTLAVWPGSRHVGAAEQHWVDAVLQLGAIALDRAELAEEITEAQLVAEKEGLRTALLSSLSHDLRTPISTILASASSLSVNHAQLGQAARLELVSVIEAEAERLNLYVANLLDMTRLESGALDVKRTPVDPSEAMAAALERMRRRLAGRKIVREFDAQGRTVLADPILLEQVLVNVLENAASFSPPGSEIVASVVADSRGALLAITDSGPGVPESELQRIFEKFFRGRTDRARRPGVGLGLSVARGIVEAFDGEIAVESPVRDARGARMVIRLPVSAPMELGD